jgi:hypothetical protein
MRDFAIHRESGAGGSGGLRRVVRLMRRLLVRILLPVFRRLSALLEDMDADQRRLKVQQECMTRQLEALLNHGWDHAALLRRMATLERQIEMLKQQGSSDSSDPLVGDHSAAAG